MPTPPVSPENVDLRDGLHRGLTVNRDASPRSYTESRRDMCRYDQCQLRLHSHWEDWHPERRKALRTTKNTWITPTLNEYDTHGKIHGRRRCFFNVVDDGEMVCMRRDGRRRHKVCLANIDRRTHLYIPGSVRRERSLRHCRRSLNPWLCLERLVVVWRTNNLFIIFSQTMTTTYSQMGPFDVFYHVEFEGRDSVVVEVFVMALWDTS